jgi:hypothetical protein
MKPRERTIFWSSVGAGLMAGLAASLLGACGIGADSSANELGDDVGDEECDGGHDDHGGSCGGGEVDLPYDVKIQCGDTLIPVIAAFREKSGDDVQFAPVPGTTAACPFVIEGATIRAEEIESCAAFTATEADATTQGNRDAGRDRIEVTWCWYAGLEAGADGSCCVPEGTSVECETDHLDIRFACDGGEGAPDGADRPLDPGAAPGSCECSDPDGCGDGGGSEDDCDGTCPRDGGVD